MGKKLPNTPRSQVRSALRQLWMRSRERSMRLKMSDNTCACCGKKKSVAKGREVKVDVHHNDCGIEWEPIFDAIYRYLLVHPDNLTVFCHECHVKEHEPDID